MAVTIEVIAWPDIERYASIPSVVRVTSILEPIVLEGGLGGIELLERSVNPYEKDYDALNPPARWPEVAPTAAWRLLLAVEDGVPVGGAAAYSDGSPRAELWDIRVRIEAQGHGIGRGLLDAASEWTASVGARSLRAETQNTNVRACRFYQRAGARLGGIDLHAYSPPVEDEVALFWYLDLIRDA
ncbi:MAG: GNAT family N-acetyltransferase [Dehalococcoidia bacterium]|nr:GNAT family N-acetyltransferase [Dehalococcoidia bacterium]